MSKGRLEALSDGVFAVILTIMVLDLKVPAGGRLEDLRSVLPVFLCYILSYVYVAIYWNNHHHLFQAATKINGNVMWANLHLLFWLSLAPFATAWMGAHTGEPWPFAVFGFVLLSAGLAFYILSRLLIRLHGKESFLAASIGSDFKGRISLVVYVAAIPLAFVRTWIAAVGWVLVALMWLVPDPRIEGALEASEQPDSEKGD